MILIPLFYHKGVHSSILFEKNKEYTIDALPFLSYYGIINDEIFQKHGVLFSMPTLLSSLLCFIVSCTGCLIQRITGFGYGIFVMMFFPHFMPSYGEANALSGMISASTSIVVALSMRKHIQWKNIFAPLISSSITSFLAVQFMAGQTDKSLKLLLGVVLILLSIYFFFFAGKITFKPSFWKGAIAGGLSGIMNGLFAMGGPPMVIYFMVSSKDMKEYLATIQMYFALSNIYTTAIKAAAGYVTSEVLVFYVIALISAFVGVFFGKKVFNRCKPAVLKKAVYGFMAVSGVINIVTTLL